MEESTEPKYEGKASAKVRGTAEQVWPFVEDFCSLDILLPLVASCYKLEGVYAQPGLIRYCELAPSNGDQTVKIWAHEKLVSINQLQQSLSYEIMENSMGFHSYVATLKVVRIDGDDEYGCEIEWPFITGPIDGLKFEDLLALVESCVRAMAERMDKVLPLST